MIRVAVIGASGMLGRPVTRALAAAGFEVTVIEDACRAIDLDGSLARAWADMAAAGVGRIRSDQI